MTRSSRRDARRDPVRPRTAAASPSPHLLRDPWSWAAALGVLPLLLACHGALLGEPVAEDFDFLHRALLTKTRTLLDGGGSQAFWRPLAHQVYYDVFGRLVLSHPGLVAALHAALLAAGALLISRALRIGLPGPVAAAAAAFPLIAESTRTLVGWPTQFVDVGLFLFSAIALHEASRRRLPSALAGLLAALLCKEVAVVTAVMLPLLPGERARGERARTALAVGVVVLVWAGTYFAVRRAAHLELPHGLEHSGAAVSLGTKLGWAVAGSLRSAFSLTLLPGREDVMALIGAFGLIASAGAIAAGSRRARERLAARRAWLGWGLGFFALCTITLVPIHPLWQPNRAQIGDLGLGLALAVLLDSAHRVLPAALMALRLALLAAAPTAAANVSSTPPESGAFMDYAHLTRLQRFMHETRALLISSHPTLSRGAVLVRANMPYGLVYAFGGDRALQVWYRDTTLRVVPSGEFRAHFELPAFAVLQFEPQRQPELALVPADAVRIEEQAFELLRGARYAEALESLARAEALVADPRPAIFHADVLGGSALALEMTGKRAEALTKARRALRFDPANLNSLRVVASEATAAGRYDEALAALDSILVRKPTPATALVRERVAQAQRDAAAREHPGP
jgi:tetratricopeptide (TPR) repeat protein